MTSILYRNMMIKCWFLSDDVFAEVIAPLFTFGIYIYANPLHTEIYGAARRIERLTPAD